MVFYYVFKLTILFGFGLTMLFGAAIIGFSLMMVRKKTEPEFEQDDQQPLEAVAETTSA